VRLTGVAASCSIVPRSHSRAIVSEVSIAEMIDMMMAISAGTIIARLSSVWLYHTRPSASIAAGGAPRLAIETFDE
jgi:hypothetical protein